MIRATEAWSILKEIVQVLPSYDYLYLGDNARTPYGTRSFDVVYHYTNEAVRRLFALGCPLVILACNTASAKALRTIQQTDLPRIDVKKRVLGGDSSQCGGFGFLFIGIGMSGYWLREEPWLRSHIRLRLRNCTDPASFILLKKPVRCGSLWLKIMSLQEREQNIL